MDSEFDFFSIDTGYDHAGDPSAEENAEEPLTCLQPLEFRAAKAWTWFRSLGSPTYFAAPMVGASELAFRMMARDYGAQMCSTPMYDAAGFASSERYRSRFVFDRKDRPLIVQFCGTDPSMLVKAALLVQDHCDAVEVNMGCPQQCAKRHGYGAFLMRKEELVRSIFTAMSSKVKVPVICKTRIFDDWEDTKRLCLLLQDSGVSMLTVHGRTRKQKRAATIPADWETIKRIKELLSIPVISNGNILTLSDVNHCLEDTHCDGVMSACGLLADPALFSDLNPRPSQVHLSRIYLQYGEAYGARNAYIGKHIYSILRSLLRKHQDLSVIVNSFRYEVHVKEDTLEPITGQRGSNQVKVQLQHLYAVLSAIEQREENQTCPTDCRCRGELPSESLPTPFQIRTPV